LLVLGDQKSLLELELLGFLLCLDFAFTLHDACLALGLFVLPDADWSKEWFEMFVEVFGSDAEVPVEEEEELLLHKVDL
jgi:hypothetical protein